MLSEQRLKNLVNAKAKEYGIAPQQIYGLYGLEQLLVKLDQSPYKEFFILKGGFLLSATYGLDVRATRDLDTTIRGFSLTEDKVKEICQFIEQPSANENFQFTVRKIKAIRNHFDYQGYNIKLHFQLGRGKFPIEIDLTTGEELLPISKTEDIPLLFSDRSVQFYVYPLEQILADKLYTTLAYGAIDDKNSRMKDLYDIYFLTKINKEIKANLVYQAIEATKKQRAIELPIGEYKQILAMLESSSFQQSEWAKYRQSNIYARDVSFAEVMTSVKNFNEQVSQSGPFPLND